MNLEHLLEKYVPKDFSKQISLEKRLEIFLKTHENKKVLDLGCGIGTSYESFVQIDPKIDWIGIDLENSPEVNARKRLDLKFLTFDGITLPFPENYFDLIYCKQVFEHVRFPNQLLQEVHRVLKPGGHFLGSTSQLEPYHSFSYWNYTPYGFITLLSEVGLKTKEIRPSIDALTLIIRRLTGGRNVFNVFWKFDSPLNFIIEYLGILLGKKVHWRNVVKLLFCGQFIFLAQKDLN